VERIKAFHITDHADRRARERGVPLDAMRNVVKYHDTKKQQYRGNHGGFVYRFTKSVDGKEFTVVAEVKKEECWLLTGFCV